MLIKERYEQKIYRDKQCYIIKISAGTVVTTPEQ